MNRNAARKQNHLPVDPDPCHL